MLSLAQVSRRSYELSLCNHISLICQCDQSSATGLQGDSLLAMRKDTKHLNHGAAIIVIVLVGNSRHAILVQVDSTLARISDEDCQAACLGIIQQPPLEVCAGGPARGG